MVFRPSAVADPLPEVDDRLVEPGTPYEMWNGELVHVPPCDAPHGMRQAELAALVRAHVAPGFSVACELLTRTSKFDDIAPDLSVFPSAPDPVTGGRQLQQLAFEVASTQTLANAGLKAQKLAGRGVRRVFAIELRRARLLEWSAELDDWTQLRATGHIVDPALKVPLPIEPLLDAAHTDAFVARAMIAQENPEIMQYRAEGEAKGRAEGEARGRAEGEARGRAEGEARGRAEGEARGRAEGRAESLLAVLAGRGIAVDDASRLRIFGERDLARFDRWFVVVATCKTVAELLAA